MEATKSTLKAHAVTCNWHHKFAKPVADDWEDNYENN